jgi:hypothetical protein
MYVFGGGPNDSSLERLNLTAENGEFEIIPNSKFDRYGFFR